MSTNDKFSTDGGQGLGHNPFGALSGLSLPQGSPVNTAKPAKNASATPVQPARNRGRVDILREKAGRGGKTVTVATGFVGIGLPEKEQLAKKIQKAAGSGGTVKDGRIEIQGDKRDVVARILTEAGFKPVFAGG